MGGSGGGFIPDRVTSEALRRRLRDFEEGAKDELFEAAVAEVIAEQLAEFNGRDVEGTRRILERIANELRDEVDGTVNLLFGGSVAKHTYVDGMSDIDALVLLSEADVEGKKPEEVRSVFAQRMIAHFGRDKVREGSIAVTIEIDGKEIQLVPAVRFGDGFKVSDWGGQKWSSIEPKKFTETLTRRNEEMDGKLVPTIKMAKAIIASLPDQRQISGYHTECLAVQVFEGYDGTKTPKAMLRRFFESASAKVIAPTHDVTGQCNHVDENLGESGSLSRRVIADAFDRLARKMKNADGAKSVERWKEIVTATPE